MTLAIPYKPTNFLEEPVDSTQVFEQSTPAILSKLVESAGVATSGIRESLQVRGAELRLVTNPVLRTDFEEALNLIDIMPLPIEWESDIGDDFMVPFKSKWSVKSTAEVRYAGRLIPNDIIDDEPLIY